MAPGKRKRGDRTYSQDSTDTSGRPSPHRPQNLGLGQPQHQQQQHQYQHQHQHQQHNNARGGRRDSRLGGRGGRGGSSAPQSPAGVQPSPTLMSPPVSTAPAFRAPLATPPTPAPAKDMKPATPAQVHVADTNDYLTQEHADSWATTGRAAVVKSATEAIAQDRLLELGIIFDELVQACLEQAMSPEQIGSAVQDILAFPPSEVLHTASSFLETINNWSEMGFDEAATAHRLLVSLLKATDIDVARMRSELNSNLLKNLNLVRDSFDKMGIRKATHALYQQSNYNLLREETEGFAKLITEYFTSADGKPPTHEVVKETWERVKALIGTFDLDVGRVLDVTLDVFANQIVKRNAFFVRLLRISSWWPELKVPHGIQWEEPIVSTLPGWAMPESNHRYSEEDKVEQLLSRERRDIEFWKQVDSNGLGAYFDLGARRIIKSAVPVGKSSDLEEAGTSEPATKRDAVSDVEKIQQWSKEWMAATNTLPPNGNRIAAQLLGFKLRFYASDTRGPEDALPDNLVYLAALLIKIGFISLLDLYPHLYPPTDKDMNANLTKVIAELKAKELAKRGVATNALATAGTLSDESPMPASVSRLRETENKAPSRPGSELASPAKSEEDAKQELADPVDQKTSLLRNLLLIGAIPEALFIVGKHPKIFEAYPDLHQYFFRLLHHSLSKVYESTRPSPVVPTTVKPGFPSKRTLRWPKLEARNHLNNVDYNFYWEDWMDNIPVCQTVDDVFRLKNSLMGFVGPEIGKDPLLLTKLARIGKKSLAEDESTANRDRWFHFCAEFLAPALSFSGHNPGVVNEVWDLFSLFEVRTRYSIYETWFVRFDEHRMQQRYKALSRRFREVESETQKLLIRMSTENMKQMARTFAKVACACPGIVFKKSLRNVESYPNFVDVLVECSKYFTIMGYDILTWQILQSLDSDRDPDRKVRQADGMLYSPWLKNISLFIGKIYRRHKLIDPTPLLRFITQRLFEGKLHVLTVLEQIITSMAGVKSAQTFSESQVYGLSAGPLLRAFTLETYLNDQRHASKSAGRLIQCLMDAGIGPQLLVVLAMELSHYPARAENDTAALKVLGNDLDILYQGFAHYLDFLRSNISIADFEENMPTLVELLSRFNVEVDVAFAISRETLAAHITAARLANAASPRDTPQAAVATSKQSQTNGDTVMVDANDKDTVNGIASTEHPEEESATSKDVDMKDITTSDDVQMNDVSNADESSATAGAKASPPLVSHSSNPVITSLAQQLREAMPETYGNHVCLDFFITFWQLSLSDLYSVSGRNEHLPVVKELYNKLQTLQGGRRAPDAKTRAEINALTAKHAGLQAEFKDLTSASEATVRALRKELSHWFDNVPMLGKDSDILHETLLQDCFVPRLRSSSQDAQFTAAMLKFMHSSGVPGFRLSKLLDLLFRKNVLANIIFMCTSREAQNVGRFLHDVLKELKAWYISESSYAKNGQAEKKRLPGFARAFNSDRQGTHFLTHKDYRGLVDKWHGQLQQAIEICLKSDEYMRIYNGIWILKEIAPTYPMTAITGKSIYLRVELVSRRNEGKDVGLAAQSLLGQLKKGEAKWITNQASFSTRSTPNSSTASSLPAMATASGLNANAPKFSPQTTKMNGVLGLAGKATTEHEDGEVNEEAKNAANSNADVASAIEEQVTGEASPTNLEGKSENSAQQETDDRASTVESRQPAASSTQPARPTSVHGRPDGRGNNMPPASNRVAHALPTKPDAQPPLSRTRPVDRPDRQAEFPAHSRNEPRSHANADYGRLDRQGDILRDPYPDRREGSPGRRPPARTPDHAAGPNDRRDPAWASRDPRDYHDDRSMRPPPRDTRGPPPPRGSGWTEQPRDSRDGRDARDPRDPRDARDIRDPRDRGDFRAPSSLPPNDGRSRMHSGPPPATPEDLAYRRDYPPKPLLSGDRGSNAGSRPLMDRLAANSPSTPLDRPNAGGGERPMINSERAAWIENDRNGGSNTRPEWDTRRDRDARQQSPRRDDRNLAPHHGRSDAGWDDRGHDRMPLDRDQVHPYPANRDRRDEQSGGAPTGPRGPRNDIPASARASREMFQPSHASRPSAHQTQDPNYGRLTNPTDSIPSGPRGHREVAPAPASSAGPPAPPASVQADIAGVHPSRRTNLPSPLSQPNATAGAPRPSLQTSNISGAPSGPRNTPRTPQGSVPSPTTRQPPTGPASATERNARGHNRGFAGAINGILNQNVPVAQGNTAPPGHTIRGRGGNRANGPADALGTSSPATSQSHPGTPNAARPDEQYARNHFDQRPDNYAQDEGRLDPRGHSRRSERSGRERSRSPNRNDRRPDERSTRNGREDKGVRNEEQEKANERERTSGRDKRGSDRDDRRERGERDSDRSTRDSRDGRERRERVSTRGEDPASRHGPPQFPPVEPPVYPNAGRGSDPRSGDSRGRGGGDRRDDRERRGPRDDGRDSRKRGRGNDEPPHHDPKRARRSLQ